MLQVLKDCFKGFLDCLERKWSLIPFWLASVDRNKKDTKPHRAYIAPDTLRRYIGYWQRYLLFCIRAITNNKDRIEFTAGQRKCLVDLFTGLIYKLRESFMKVTELYIAIRFP